MTVSHIDHYNIRASAELLEQVREFYSEALGLVVGERPPFRESGYWLYAGDHAVLHLSLAGDGEELADNIRTTLNHVAFSCQGRPEVEARLEGLGVEFRRAAVPATKIVQLFLQDPAGNGIELSFGDEA